MIRKLFFLTNIFTALLLISGCSTAKSVDQKTSLPFEWPVSPLSIEQIEAVRNCDVENLARHRYPENLKAQDFEATFQPKSDCDWAVLAFAHIEQQPEGGPLPEAGMNAFQHSVLDNYGFALATPIFYRYFDTTSLVKSPLFTQQNITNIKIRYEWSGLGEQVKYFVDLQQANTSPTVKLDPASISTSTNLSVDTELLQALSQSLTNLVPVKSRFSLTPCTDNYPEWNVLITFQDGMQLSLFTSSNFIPLGGPWLVEIDHQYYVQYSSEFAKALDKIIQALGLPYGQPAGWTCFGDDVFEKAFPDGPTPTPQVLSRVPTHWESTWLSQPVCKPPCWQNIIPEKTTWDQAVVILEKMPNTTITYQSDTGLDWTFGSNNSAGGWLSVQDHIVTFVVLSASSSKLTLENVVAVYDMPDYVYPKDCRYGMCVTDLVYPDLGMVLDVFIENTGFKSDSIKIELHPETIVDRVTFIETGLESFLKTTLPEDNIPLMQWKGYDKYP